MNTTWYASWTQAVTDITATDLHLADTTLRFSITGSVGGDQLRVQLSNSFGTTPLVVGGAAVRVNEKSPSPLLFGGRASAEIPSGAGLVSDPADVQTNAGDTIEIDIYLPEPTELTTGNVAAALWHPSSPGNHSGLADFPRAATPVMPLPGGGEINSPAPILRGVEVARSAPTPVVVCLGDSITAFGWPERTAKLLKGKQIAVVNRGIGGNRLRLDGSGPLGAFFGVSGLARFDSDVLGTAGATHVVIALGTNDLGHPGTVAPETELPSADEVIAALKDIGEEARSAGLTVLYATITPFLPAAGYDKEREAIRMTVNGWIRAQQPHHGLIDFDAALRSERAHDELDPRYDSGDHLHPSDQGLDRLAEAAANVIGSTMSSP